MRSTDDALWHERIRSLGFPVIALVLLAAGCAGSGDGSTGRAPKPSAADTVRAAPSTTDGLVATASPPRPEPTPIHQTAQGVGLDGDPTTPDLEVGEFAFRSGQIFTIGLDIVTVPAPYVAYSWDILFGGAIAYVGETPSKPVGFTRCQELKIAEGEIYGGCINTVAVTYVGTIVTASFRCIGAGRGQIWLRRPRDPGNIGFATELIAPGGAVLTGDVGPAITAVCS